MRIYGPGSVSRATAASRAVCPRIIWRALRGGVEHLVEVGANGRVDRWQARRQLLELPGLLWCGKLDGRSLRGRRRRLRRRRRKLSGFRGSGCSRDAECRPRAEQRSPPCARRLVARRWRFQQKQQRRQPGEAHELAETAICRQLPNEEMMMNMMRIASVAANHPRRGAASLLHPGHRGTRYYAAPYHAARILAVSHTARIKHLS